jgi:hypothetical protein
MAKLSTITISSNIQLDSVDVRKLSDGYELQIQKMSLIFEVMGHYYIVE